MKIMGAGWTLATILYLSLRCLFAAETPKVNADGVATGEVAGTEAGEDQAAELAKQLSNPISLSIKKV